MKKYDIIWNLSLACPWDCNICCVDAIYTKDPEKTTKERQNKGLELTFDEKVAVLKQFKEKNVKWNFSGGDPLIVSENIELIKIASEMFGKENIQISTTGAGLLKVKQENLDSFISVLKFSYDDNTEYNPLRPRGYNGLNLKIASKFDDVITVAETPLTINNIKKDKIELLYKNLNKANIDRVLPMRLFPVGRGIHFSKSIPSAEEYNEALNTFKDLENKYGHPYVKVQCAFKNLYSGNDVNPCNLFRESFAIMPNGRLNISAWAYGCNEEALDQDFVLGNLKYDSLDSILNSEKSKYIEKHMDDNFGHCKIFAFLNSKNRGLDRLFDKTDPLYDENK